MKNQEKFPKINDQILKGSFVALVTPMRESGEIDWDAFENLVEWQIAEGTNGIVIAGSTGEESSLTREEKLALFKRAVEIAKSRIPIVAGTGGPSTRETLELTEEAKKLGASAALVINPYYNRATDRGCFAHFSEVAKAGLPLILYHNPARTGTRLSLEAIARICEIPEVAAVKDASGDLNLAIELMQRIEKPIFSGDDVLCFPHLAIGYQGVISIVCNLIPREWGEFVRNPTREDFFKYYSLCRSLVLEPNPQGIKYALSKVGKCKAVYRLPLVPPQLETQKRISAEVSKRLLTEILM